MDIILEVRLNRKDVKRIKVSLKSHLQQNNLVSIAEVVKCQECGKVIGVCGVSYGHESAMMKNYLKAFFFS